MAVDLELPLVMWSAREDVPHSLYRVGSGDARGLRQGDASPVLK